MKTERFSETSGTPDGQPKEKKKTSFTDSGFEFESSYWNKGSGIDRCFYCMKPMKGSFCTKCGRRREQMNGEDELPAGTVLWNGDNSYLIGRVLGRGGFGITYLGWDNNLERKVAIKEFFRNGSAERDPLSHQKVIIPDTAREEYLGELERFRSEARRQARYASCPETAGVLEQFTDNNTAYMVMTYVEGTTLSEYISTNGPMSFAEACALLCPLTAFLGQIHRDGMIHRDISSTNIMIDQAGKARLLDFGAARKYVKEGRDGTLGQVNDYSVILRYGFAPPEQYNAHGVQTPATDIYAFAASFYYAVTGQVPVRADLRENGTEIARPSSLRQGITEKQDQVLLKALSLSPEERYHSMEEMESALRQAAADNGSGSGKGNYTRYLLAIAVLLFLIFGLSAFALAMFLNDSGSEETDPEGTDGAVTEIAAREDTSVTEEETAGGGETSDTVTDQIEYGPNTVNFEGKAYEIFSAPEAGISGKDEMRQFCQERGGQLASGESRDQCRFLARLVLNTGLKDAVIEAQNYDIGIRYDPFLDSSNFFICQWNSPKPGAEEDKLYPDDAMVYEKHSYQLIEYESSGVDRWSELLAYCALRGGYPAEINDLEENDSLYRYTVDLGKKNVIFGYTDMGHEGSWVWVNGTSSYKDHWADETQPDNDGGVEHFCAFSDINEDGRWNDVPFAMYTDSFLCEWDTAAH